MTMCSKPCGCSTGCTTRRMESTETEPMSVRWLGPWRWFRPSPMSDSFITLNVVKILADLGCIILFQMHKKQIPSRTQSRASHMSPTHRAGWPDFPGIISSSCPELGRGRKTVPSNYLLFLYYLEVVSRGCGRFSVGRIGRASGDDTYRQMAR